MGLSAGTQIPKLGDLNQLSTGRCERCLGGQQGPQEPSRHCVGPGLPTRADRSGRANRARRGRVSSRMSLLAPGGHDSRIRLAAAGIGCPEPLNDLSLELNHIAEAGPPEAEAGGVLTIDLGALVANWRLLE